MKAKRNLYAPRESDQLAREASYRDVRPLSERIWATVVSHQFMVVLLVAGIPITLLLPELFIIVGPLVGAFYLIGYRRRGYTRMNMRMPKIAGDMYDYGDRAPGGKGFRQRYNKARGTFFLGNTAYDDDHSELYFAPEDILTHFLVLGTTGAGKTETLLSMCFNALAQGSGFYYIDPKAGGGLPLQVQYMARVCGRDDDVLIQNFGGSGAEIISPDYYLRGTNTQNLFTNGNGNDVLQIVISLISVSTGDNAIFGQNAQSLMLGLLYALVSKRDNSDFFLSFKAIREYLAVNRILQLAQDPVIDDYARNALVNALSDLGYMPERGPKQPENFFEQYKYASAYFSLPLSLITLSHGNIYTVPIGEIDLFDVISNRRILVVMLPSLKKAPDQLRELGKISLSAVKLAVSAGLPDQIVGHRSKVLDNNPMLGRAPFLLGVDEYAAIRGKSIGFEQIVTMARSLGTACMVGNQDYAGIEGDDPVSAKQMIGNLKIKLVMTQEDPQATWELVKAIAGQEQVAMADGYQMNGQMSLTYSDQLGARVQEVNRANYRALTELIEGECFVSFKGNWIPATTFFANASPPEDHFSVVHRFVPMPPPDQQALTAQFETARELYQRLVGDTNKIIESAKEYSNLVPDSVLERLGTVEGNAQDKLSAAAGAFVRWVKQSETETRGRINGMNRRLAGEEALEGGLPSGLFGPPVETESTSSEQSEDFEDMPGEVSATAPEEESQTPEALREFFAKTYEDGRRIHEDMVAINQELEVLDDADVMNDMELIRQQVSGYGLEEEPAPATTPQVQRSVDDLVETVVSRAKSWK